VIRVAAYSRPLLFRRRRKAASVRLGVYLANNAGSEYPPESLYCLSRSAALVVATAAPTLK